MKSKRFVSLSILSILSLGLLTGIVTHHATQASSEVLTTEAWDINVQPSVTESFYSSCDGKTGSTLKSALAAFNKPAKPSYDWDRYEAADEAQDDSASILCLYTRHNIKKNAHVGSYSWDTWNREHVYTQTAFPNSAKDNHNIFACEGQINNTRGNLKFAEVKNSGGTRVSEFGHTTDCYVINGSYFEPCDEAKGEVARACLYCTVYYGYNLSQIFDSQDTALKWNAMYPVTPREIYRNNIVQGLQGNRNPFIDHPSYAQAIYGGPAYQGTDPVGPQDPVAVTGVSLNKTSASLEVSDTLQLTATVTPSNATNKAVTWNSNNTTVASVSNTGLITAKAAGSAAITVTTADGGFTATCNVTVTAPVPVLTSITLSGNYQKSFRVNDTFNHDGLVVTANYSVGGSHVVNDYVISEPNMSTAGTKTVTVSYTDGVTKTASYQITVDNLVSITLSGGKREFVINEAFSYAGLVVTANYAVAASRTVTPTSVSTPDTSSLGEKEVTVSYTENGITQSASYFINVVSEPSPVIPVESITLNFERKEILVGQSFELVVTFNPENATNKELRWEIDYFDDPDYEGCIGIQDGWITGLKVGYAGIMITSLDNPRALAFCMVKIVKDKPSPKKSGCFGSVEATSIILSSLSILGIGLLLIKRKTSDK